MSIEDLVNISQSKVLAKKFLLYQQTLRTFVAQEALQPAEPAIGHSDRLWPRYGYY